MLDLKSAAALVPGSSLSKEKAKMKVKAVKGFMYEGKVVAPGTEIEVDEAVGHEVVGSNKAVSLDEPKAAAEKAKVDETQYSDWSIEDMKAYLLKNDIEYSGGDDRAALEAACKAWDAEQIAESKAAPTKGALTPAPASAHFDGWTNDDLRSYLDKKKIYYPSNATKADLVELANTAPT